MPIFVSLIVALSCAVDLKRKDPKRRILRL
jgi:hypothetical protein